MLLLQARYIIQGTEDVRYGSVAAWTQTQAEGTPGHGFHVLSGYADPIMAARLIEEATKDEGYVWVIPDQDNTGDGEPGEVQLGSLSLIYGADIHSGRVRVLPDSVGAPTGSKPEEVPSGGTNPDEHGPSLEPQPTPGGDSPSTGSGLIQAAGEGS